MRIENLEELYKDANQEDCSLYKWWTSSTGDIELVIHSDDIKTVCVSGPNDEQVAELNKAKYIQMQLEKVTEEAINGALGDSCLGDDIQKNRDDKEEILLWVACWDIHGFMD